MIQRLARSLQGAADGSSIESPSLELEIEQLVVEQDGEGLCQLAELGLLEQLAEETYHLSSCCNFGMGDGKVPLGG